MSNKRQCYHSDAAVNFRNTIISERQPQIPVIPLHVLFQMRTMISVDRATCHGHVSFLLCPTGNTSMP
jgi:hypothetical protein